MNLSEHLEILGWTPDHLAFRTKIEKPVIHRALAGKPITKKHADKIRHKIGLEFGHHSTQHNGQDAYHIDGIETVGE